MKLYDDANTLLLCYPSLDDDPEPDPELGPLMMLELFTFYTIFALPLLLLLF